MAHGHGEHAVCVVTAALAARALARGDAARFLDLMDPCETLGRHVFCAPTQHYKAGLAFLAWLNGQQDNFLLVNREELHRDREHYLACAQLAQAAGCVHSDTPQQ